MCPHVQTKPVKILQEGSFIGEAALLLNLPREATCRASAYCELFTLERADLNKILNHFPDVKSNLHDILDNRITEALKYIAQKNDPAYKQLEGTTTCFITEEPAISYTNYVHGDYVSNKRASRRESMNLVATKYIISRTNKFLKAWKIFFSTIYFEAVECSMIIKFFFLN